MRSEPEGPLDVIGRITEQRRMPPRSVRRRILKAARVLGAKDYDVRRTRAALRKATK